ncbi:MAG: amidohydrolase family protein [Betaproteobacteria bacterium]|nr:amidohydrolase family protein [Betaproteobacteria bacterium]
MIDAHHHIWRLAHTPWLNGPVVPRIFGDYEPLRRDYPVEEYLAEATAAGVVKSVYVQVNVAPGAEIEEVEWVQSIADTHGFPHGIVGYADLAAANLSDTLDRQLGCRNLRGIRQQLHWHEKPLYCFASHPDLMDDAAWRAGLKEVGRRGLVFELQVFASQMMDSARLARDFPEVTFVLLHAGMLEDRRPQGWARWRNGMRELSACPNVCTKFSGLGTFERRCDAVLWRPVIEETLALFGPDRAMFGSNFPIEKLWTGYADLVAATRAGLAQLTPGERHEVMYATAERVYRL